jgi:hypothetical protein
MSTTEPIAAAASPAALELEPAEIRPPRRAAGVELIGEFEGSGFKEPPLLARRGDGQVVQLTRLLFLVAEACDGLRDESPASGSSAASRRSDPPEQRVCRRLRVERHRDVADRRHRRRSGSSSPDSRASSSWERPSSSSGERSSFTGCRSPSCRPP